MARERRELAAYALALLAEPADSTEEQRLWKRVEDKIKRQDKKRRTP